MKQTPCNSNLTLPRGIILFFNQISSSPVICYLSSFLFILLYLFTPTKHIIVSPWTILNFWIAPTFVKFPLKQFLIYIGWNSLYEYVTVLANYWLLASFVMSIWEIIIIAFWNVSHHSHLILLRIGRPKIWTPLWSKLIFHICQLANISVISVFHSNPNAEQTHSIKAVQPRKFLQLAFSTLLCLQLCPLPNYTKFTVLTHSFIRSFYHNYDYWLLLLSVTKSIIPAIRQN